MARLDKIKLPDGNIYNLGEDISGLVQRVATLEDKVATLGDKVAAFENP